MARQISVSQLDAMAVLCDQTRHPRKRMIAYADASYFSKGPEQFLNRLTPAYHLLATFVQGELSCPRVLTYDNMSSVRTVYKHLSYDIVSFRLQGRHRAQRSRVDEHVAERRSTEGYSACSSPEPLLGNGSCSCCVPMRIFNRSFRWLPCLRPSMVHSIASAIWCGFTGMRCGDDSAHSL